MKIQVKIKNKLSMIYKEKNVFFYNFIKEVIMTLNQMKKAKKFILLLMFLNKKIWSIQKI